MVKQQFEQQGINLEFLMAGILPLYYGIQIIT